MGYLPTAIKKRVSDFNKHPIDFTENKITKGHGVYSKINYDIGDTYRYSLGYWNADTFFAPRGEFLFQSLSDFDSKYFQKKRSIIVMQFSIKRISNEAMSTAKKSEIVANPFLR